MMKQGEIVRIFSDAHVVDLDWSVWGQEISWLVLADHFRDWTEGGGGLCPLLLLTFSDVSLFEFRRDVSVPVGAFEGHMQWVVDNVEIHASAPWDIEFWGRGQFPRVRMNFREWSREELSHAVVEKIAPGWRRPGAPLIRRGWKAMLAERHLVRR